MAAAETELRLHRAARVVDGAGVDATPGVLLVRGHELLAAGAPERVGVPAGVRIEDHPDEVLLPALGNAHAHLDLTAIEPFPFDGDFAHWLGVLRSFRAEAAVAGAKASRRAGAELSLTGGVCLVGDIVGAPLGPDDLHELDDLGIAGVAFIEIFGAGRGRASALDRMERTITASVHDRRSAPWHLGIQPHAPYSTCDEVMRRALARDLPFSTHLAESADEVEFCRRGRGPLRDLLVSVGAMDRERVSDGREQTPTDGRHPVDWFCDLLAEDPHDALALRDAVALRDALVSHDAHPAPDALDAAVAPARERGVDTSRVPRVRAPRMAVHLNELEPGHAPRLAREGVFATICPRATCYFGRTCPPWRALRAAGVVVALGTDGRLCLDTADRISTLDEMRWLARFDGASLEEVLPMATTAVARSLGFDPAACTLQPGVKPGILRLRCGDDPRHGPLRRNDAPQWLVPVRPWKSNDQRSTTGAKA